MLNLTVNSPRYAIKIGFMAICLITLTACSLVQDDERSSRDDGEQDSVSQGLIAEVETVPAEQPGSFTFSGVGAPQGVSVSSGGAFTVDDLEPGTYTLTQVDPAPDFDLGSVTCDDGDSEVPSAGDATTRTAVFNIEAEEMVTCTFVNVQRGTVVITAVTEPEREAATFGFSGVGAPEGVTIPNNGSFVVSNLEAGTYSITEMNPSPTFDLTEVSCDDASSSTPSAGDPATRTAVMNIDPGEMVTCTFVNAARGSIEIRPVIEPQGEQGSFVFSGVGAPQGKTVTAGETMVVDALPAGTYTITEFDPAPDFELTQVYCDDADSPIPSAGDASTRTAVFNLDPGENVLCTFVNTADDYVDLGSELGSSSGSGGEFSSGGGEDQADGINPFTDPETYLPDFALPEDLPSDAGTYALPLEGPWSAINLAGSLDCGFALTLPSEPPESGTITILEDRQSVLAESFDISEGASITMTAHPEIIGYFTGTFDATQEGVPITIQYYWQLVTPEYIVGYLTSSFSSEGVTCTIYRPFELRYTG